MAVSQNFPNILPTLNLDFANQKELDPRVTFSRSSSGTYVGRDGLIKTARVNEPRFDHDPVSGVCNGLLVEESRSNLEINSAIPSFLGSTEGYGDLMTWTTEVTSTPFGNISVAKISRAANYTQNPRLLIRMPATNGTYTYSCFMKAVTTSNSIVSFGRFNGSSVTTINLNSGTFYSLQQGTNNKIIPYGNGWYRVICTGSSSTTGVYGENYGFDAAGLGQGYATTFYAFGFQIELGSFESSYIPTSGSQVTRSADIAQITGNNFSSWYNQSGGTFYAEGIATNTQNARILTFSDSTFGAIFTNQNPANAAGRTILGPSTLTHPYGFGGANVTVNSRYKIAATIVPSAYTKCSVNGQNAGTSPGLPNTTLLNPSVLQIGPGAGGGGKGNVIGKISYYSAELSSSQLQQLTR